MARIGVVDVPVAIKLVELPLLGERPIYVNPAHVVWVCTGVNEYSCELKLVGISGSYTIMLPAKDAVEKLSTLNG